MKGPTSPDISAAYAKALKQWKSVLRETVKPPSVPQGPPTVRLGTTPKFILEQVPRRRVISG